MPKSKGDPVRKAKWSARTNEWEYLAMMTSDQYVKQTCLDMAKHSNMMAEFWSGK